MKINNEFTVGAPIQQAWDTMLNLERIAPCLPGAAIQEEKGEGEYDGTMKVKIGPITANYKGTVKFEEADEDNHRAVLQATGRDARGQGTASATIVSTLLEEGEGTKVSVETDMKLTGRAAQFGRGIAQDVATKMLDQFASCLEEEITGGPEEGAAAAATAEPTGEENGSRDGSQQEDVPPAAATGGTAGRVISSEDPTVMAGGTVEGAVVAGPGSAEASSGAPTTGTEQPEPQQAPRREREEQEAFDIGAASQEAILKRAKPLLIGAGVFLVLIWLLRRR
ncbi:MAG TPA: SRPBCC family protein [Rubrobacter sp.]|jgi:carbon monoxide dehydrogenase subunit G|nr:SRPBCC family protein [Rubrobacter sp.]HKH58483.1 SRPBCC family protein [Rubrobacter sp.]